MLSRYLCYLKYYCGLFGSTDSTAEQILNTLGYSAKSGKSKSFAYQFNKMLVERGFLYIRKTRDFQGHTRNIYTTNKNWTPNLINQPNIKHILELLKKPFIEEYRFISLPKYRFDFFIENCYIIEYDGEQHYLNKTDKVWSDTLAARQQRDKIKNNYCLIHNIPLYRIPYWEKNNISLDLIFSETNLVKNI